MIEVNPATALKAVTDNPPFAWTIHATTQYLMKNNIRLIYISFIPKTKQRVITRAQI